MNTLPVLLKEPKVLVVGGGNVGLHKAKVLSKNEITFSVISEKFSDGFSDIDCEKKERSFEDCDIEGFTTIIDATGSTEVKNRLLLLKGKYGFLLNIVDDPEFCDFYFSSIVQRGKIKVAVSSNGASPTMTQVIRDEIDSMLPHSLETISDLQAKNRSLGIIDAKNCKIATKKTFRRVGLVGCGLGDPELLTIKAYKEIQNAEVVLYDNLITPEIVALADKNAELIKVGKQKGHHSHSQDEINALIVKHFNEGKRVIRLKSGDPFIFGRGAEESLCLKNEGIPFEIFNGISSSVCASSLAGVPLTVRGYSAGFSVVSAHLKENKINLDWIELLKKESHTTVVLMGLSLAKNIQKAAFEIGIEGKKNIAIIANASRTNQQVIFTTLNDLPHDAKKAVSPAILVFGGGVDFSLDTDFFSH